MTAWKDMIIPINSHSRSGKKLTSVRKLVIHWTANYGATAMNHYNYFKNLKDRYASAHIFVDKNEALCIIPLNEVTYHANDGSFRGVPELKPDANYLSISVEMCVEKDGSFHPNMIARTEDVFVELCKKYGLNPLTDIVRHYDITHKDCPSPWVRNGQAFVDFKNRVKAKMGGKVAEPKPTKPVPDKFGTNPTIIMKVKALVKTDIRKAPSHYGGYVRDTQVGEVFDVYQIENGWHCVGGTNWIDGNDGQNLYWLDNPALKGIKVNLPSGVYNKGDKGSAVKQIQEALNKLGFNCGTPDGVFGNNTYNALKSFQSKNGLVADGVYGAKTEAKMEGLLK